MIARLADALRQQRLAEGVVDLVGAGVGEVFALQPDARAAALARQPLGEVERRRPADVMLEQVVQFAVELRVVRACVVGDFEFLVRADERLGDVPPAEFAEARRQSVLQRPTWYPFRRADERADLLDVLGAVGFDAARDVDAPRLYLFHGAATFSGVRPPASKNGMRPATSAATSQSNVSPVPPSAPVEAVSSSSPAEIPGLHRSSSIVRVVCLAGRGQPGRRAGRCWRTKSSSSPPESCTRSRPAASAMSFTLSGVIAGEHTDDERPPARRRECRSPRPRRRTSAGRHFAALAALRRMRTPPPLGRRSWSASTMS